MIDCDFILFPFGNISSFKGKQLRFLLAVLKRDVGSSQSTFIQEINI